MRHRQKELDFNRKRRKVNAYNRRRRKGIGKIKRPGKKFHLNLEYLAVVGRWIFKIAVTCLLAFVAVWYFGQSVSTVGDSMSPVLSNADVVLTNRILYNASSPKRGDIIVFKPKGNENAHYYIKRIIGLPGETVEIIENNVYIDGEKLEEDYATSEMGDVGIADEKIELAGDEYFVLGDNRESSEDSRNADIGNVKREYIYGKAWFVVSPRKHFGFIE
ncbi:MAG: signal peptidase I [Dorea sp.]|nr:signal peptidase I [Dorea sp.]